MTVLTPRSVPLLVALALATGYLALGPAEAPAQATASGVSGGFFKGGESGRSPSPPRSIGQPFGTNRVPGAFGGEHVPGAFGGPALLESPGNGKRPRDGKRFRQRPGAVTPFPFLLTEPAILRRRGVVAAAAQRARTDAARAAAEEAELSAARAEVAAERARLERERAEAAPDPGTAAPTPPPAPPSEDAGEVGRALKEGSVRSTTHGGPASCALVRVRTPAGIGMRHRVDPGRIGAGSPAQAHRILRERLRAGEPLVLPGPEGELTLPATLVDELIVGPC